MKNVPKTIEVLKKAQIAIPEFKEKAQCFINNVELGKKPDTGC
jgi:hypothetical protein